MSELKKNHSSITEKPFGIELNDVQLEQVAGGADHDGFRWCPDCDSYVTATIHDDGSATCQVCGKTL